MPDSGPIRPSKKYEKTENKEGRDEGEKEEGG